MTNLIKNKLLYQLEFLKSIGYLHHENFEFQQSNNEINLPDNLEKLEKIVKSCYLCELSKVRKNVLFSEGNPNSKIFFIGEEPSTFEDELAQYHVGKSGEIFLNMLQNVLKLSRNDVYYTSIVKCKTSNGLNFSHVDCCNKFLQKQIDLVNPSLIVLLGEKTYKYFLKNELDFFQQRGQILKYRNIDLIATFSPSFLLRNPSLKKDAYYDILKIKNIMESWN